jgi:alkylhydroperoxidase family enzyme
MPAALFPTPLTSEEAWGRLPPAIKGEGSPLPIWARQLAAFLPRSTAALLQLDYAQRANNPIPPRLRAAMRFVSASFLGCPAGEEIAVNDALAVGISDTDLQLLARGDFSAWAESEQRALRFMQKMDSDPILLGNKIFQHLVGDIGEKVAASMVLLSAYSNFVNRLLLCLGTPTSESDYLPAQEIAFAPEQLVSVTTPPPPVRPRVETSRFEDAVDTFQGWSQTSFEQLQERLEAQRQMKTRLPIPDWDICAKNLPPGLISKPSDIIWYRIVFGYAPELAVPFEYFMRTSGAEAAGKWDRIFATSLFWITTKAIDCPYCMGHCEMNFEVAGLDKKEIASLSRILGGDDWSGFPPREQRAFRLAIMLTSLPREVSSADIAELRQDFGDETALIIILNCCRYHYMTRISNGFQLTLERDNVFFDYYNLKNGK